jgi:hypothetical protein
MKWFLLKLILISLPLWMVWQWFVTDQPPHNAHNICDIFAEKKHWHSAAKKASEKWHVPIVVPMAMMFQESSFRQNAKPSMRYFLWVIPIGRRSSAYGFSQALDNTWSDYKREVRHQEAQRSDFADAIDFMAWFIHKTNRINKVSTANAQHQYLNYHEGWGGYKKKSYRKKRWLIRTSRIVKQRADTYAAQYQRCKSKLNQGFFSW